MSVNQELYHIFTYYTLHGNALDPEHLALTQMVQVRLNSYDLGLLRAVACWVSRSVESCRTVHISSEETLVETSHTFPDLCF